MANFLLKTAERAARTLPRPIRQILYRLGPVSGWIRRLLNRAAPQGLTVVRVAAGSAAGLTMRLDLQREKDYWLGTYESALQETIRHQIRQGMVVFDVGANIGYLSLIFARETGESGTVYAFEALPGNVGRLSDHVALNGFSDRIRVIHAAVVDRPGPVEFLVHASHGMGKAAGSAGRDTDYPDRITVSGVSIDDFVFNQGHARPDMVKMDIEGGEVLALSGMAQTLEKVRPVVFLELHGQEAARSAWETFSAAKYSLHRMDSALSPIRSLSELDWKAYVVARPPRSR